MIDLARIEEALRGRLDGERLRHTRGVVDAAVAMARRWGADPEKARLAALLHDYAKGLPPERLLELGRRFGVIADPAEEAFPDLLHAPVGAELVREEGLAGDPEVLAAIRWHTTGTPGMGLLEKVIWLADMIEPGREFPGVESIRRLAERDLDGALLAGLDHTIAYVLRTGRLLHLGSVRTRNWLLAERRRAGKPWPVPAVSSEL